MKKAVIVLALAVCLVLLLTAVAGAESAKFVTIQEWTDANGACGDCMLLLRIRAILNPVLAIAEDETGTVNLFSGNGEESMIVNFMGDEGLTEGSVLVIANPRWNEYEGTVEMADWTVLCILPSTGEETGGNLRAYQEMDDGTWTCEGYTYQYCITISGRMPNAAVNSTFTFLSNVPQISFEQAYKAAGISSDSEDYFSPEDAVLVDMH